MLKTCTVGKKLLVVAIIAIMCITYLTACDVANGNKERVGEIDYTVVEEADYPEELKKLIDERKANSLKLTYTTKDYTYVVMGYGTRQTTGYSIRVNDVYKTESAICVDVSLIGPESTEEIINTPTTPVIVLKMERREETISFIM